MYATPTNVVPTLLVCYFVWRFIRRVRRNIGRQPVRPTRMTFSIVIFSLVTLGLAAISPREANFALGLGGGVLAGIVLGLIGLRLTAFEVTGEGRFFTPNTYLGVGVSLLLVGRLIYRMTVLYSYAHHDNNQPPGMLQSPLTYFLYGIVAGYYITYYIGIFICTRASNPAKTNA